MTTLTAPSTAPAKPEPTTTLLFGGIDLRSPPGPNNELFAFELLKPKEGSDSGGTIEWTRIGADEVTGAFPAPRWRHTATAISKTQLLVFGGFRDSTTRLNDLHVYDHANKTWTQPVSAMPPAAGEGAHFRRVKKAQAQQKAVVLATSRSRDAAEEEKKQEGAPDAAAGGGNKSTSFLEDLGVPLNDPLAQDGNPNAPTPRGAHSATLIGDYLYIFGGYGASTDARFLARYARQVHACGLLRALGADYSPRRHHPFAPALPCFVQVASATRAATSTTSTACTCRL